MPIAGTIIAAIIGAGVSIVGAGMQSSSQSKAQKESRELADITRADTLAAQKEQGILSRQTIAQNEKHFQQNLAFQKEETAKSRAMEGEQIAANRKQQAFGNALAMLNGNRSLSDSFGKYWGKR